MDKNQNMVLNAICLFTVPEVIKMSAAFSGMTELLEKSMEGFITALSGRPAELNLNSYFNDELDELVLDVINQLHNQSDSIFKEYAEQVSEIKTSGALEIANQQVEYFNNLTTDLKSLTEILTAKDIFAYISILNSEDDNCRELIKFIDCFDPIFKKMQQDRKAEAELEQQNIVSWFTAANENDVNTLANLYEGSIKISLKNNSGKTALAIAVSKKNLEAVNYLLAQDACPIEMFSDDSPLSIAVENNSSDIVAAILSSSHEKLKEVNWSNFFSSFSSNIISDEYRLTIYHIIDFNSDEIDLGLIANSAIQNNANELLAGLFNHGLTVDDEFYSEPLIFIALKENNEEALKILINNNVDINKLNRHEKSLLESAVEQESTIVLNLLINDYKEKVNVNFFNHYNSQDFIRKLSKMTNRSFSDCLKLKLFDPTVQDNFGRSFFQVIVTRYDEEDTPLSDMKSTIDTLINDFKIDINQITSNGDDTVVTLANHETIFEYLMSYKPNISLELNYNKSVLAKIVNMLDGRALEITIKSGIDPNAVVTGMPLLHYCFKSKPEHIKLLIENGADLNATDNSNFTVLQKWVVNKEVMEPHLIEMAKRGTDFSLNVENGLPIFHAISATYNADIINSIIDNSNINIHVADESNNNAMMQASLAKNHSSLILLAKLGVDVNQANIIGGTPLLHAVYEDDTELFNTLVNDCGAKTDTLLAGKTLIFIANQLASYGVLHVLNEQQK